MLPPPASLARQVGGQLKLRRAQCWALLRNRYDSGPLVLCALLLIVLAAADVLYQLLAPMPAGCSRDFFWGVGVPRGCEPAFYISVSITCIRLCIVAGCLVGVWAQRVVRIHLDTARGGGTFSAARHLLPGRRSVEDLKPRRRQRQTGLKSEVVTLSDVRVWGSGSAGWALASSKQSWLETTRAVYSNVWWMVSTTLSVTGLLALINLVTALTEKGWADGASWDYACRTCTDGEEPSAVQLCVSSGSAPLNMCFLAWQGRLVFPFLVGGQVVSLGLLTALTPLRVWDPVAVDAGRATGLRWLELLRVMHYPVALGIVNVPAPLIAFGLMEFHVAPRLFLVISGYSSVICGTLQLLLAAWVLWFGARHQQAAVPSPKRSRSILLLRQWLSGLLPTTASSIGSLFLKSAAGLNSKLQYQLVVVMFIFSAQISAYGAVYYMFLLLLRVVILIVFAFTRDQQTDFRALRRDPNGAGFGLVVDVCMLAEALRRYLANEPLLEHIPTYKATVYRMEATMTVSYRWQETEVYICPGRALNMSRWQMERMVAAFQDTSCFYVWIDRLSVPQYECELQNTLLSRMMATFASARETLVLRSLEENGSRYHQRAWTLPEFVCSASPRIFTQPEAKDEERHRGFGEAWPLQGSELAYTPAEEVQVARVRQFYLSHLCQCRPLWLHPNGEVSFDFCVDELESVWEMYQGALEQLLNCSIPEDRIRAVYPLFFCVPVDNHEELVCLVDEVAKQLATRNSPGAHIARRHYLEIMGAAVVDETDESSRNLSTSGERSRSVMSRMFTSAASALASASIKALTSFHSTFTNGGSGRIRRSNSSLHDNRTGSGSIASTVPAFDVKGGRQVADNSDANARCSRATVTPTSSPSYVYVSGEHLCPLEKIDHQ